MPSLRASLLARHAALEAELTRRRQHVLADLAPAIAPPLAVAPAAPFFVTLWRELFLPARPVWSALACVWLVLIGFAAANRVASPPVGSVPPSATALIVAWKERERALAALLAPTTPVELPLPSGKPTSFILPRRTSLIPV